MSDLKPCPFCGGEALIGEYPHNSSNYEVTCPNVDCQAQPDIWKETKLGAIAAWSTRIPDPAAIWREAMEAAVTMAILHFGYEPSDNDMHTVMELSDNIRAIPNPYEATE